MLWIFWLIVSLLVGAFLFLVRIGHLVESGNARRVLKRSDRRGKFILYLRGFDADVPWSGMPLFHWGIFGIFGALSGTTNHPALAPAARFETFIKRASEEALGNLPLVAVASDGQVLGVGRVAIDASEWKVAVASLCEDARTVIFLVGGSTGLMWELVHLFDARHLRKTVFVIPPWDIMQRQYGAAAETIVLRAREIFKTQGIEMPRPNHVGRVFRVSDSKDVSFVEDLATLWSTDRALAVAIGQT